MPQSRHSTLKTNSKNALWETQARVLHWLAAISLAGATALSTQSELGHTALGFVALGALLIQLIGTVKTRKSSPALWLVTAIVIILALSGWLAPNSTFHLGTTLAALVLASLYCATVLFESLQRFTTSEQRCIR